ncbi:MAG: hypothetical protein DI530_00695 [Sphingomonas sp.]|uniref:heparinase II/III domain-containing protein n=1 Tax=Sphingomonas sp. TaxID=28214 RepID=UPI000DBC29BB|nr:heparinase II/III family protein [Sphingomonas sp.]PZU81629.1 MAG: hypothetical protein DI530_00695 [Sphingomonas sp.]
MKPTLPLMLIAIAVMTGIEDEPAPAQAQTVDPAARVAADAAPYLFGQPLRRAVEDWDAARRRVATDPAAQQWLRGVRARTDSWIAGYGDRADWVAGWAHDMVDARTGLPVSWQWTTPEPPAGSKAHGAWVFYRRTANIQTVLDAARLFRLTGQARYRDWAAQQLDLYAAGYARWPLQTFSGQSRMMGQSLDEATASISLADAARLIAPAVDPGRVAQWNSGLFAPMLGDIVKSNSGRNNIAVWQASASAVLAAHLGRDADYRAAIDGPNGIRAMLDRGVTPDGLWFEPSAGYAAYTIQALASLFTFASLNGRDAPLRAAMETTQRMLISRALMRFSDGTLPAYGDTTYGTQAFPPALIEQTQRTMPIRAGTLRLSWATLLDPDMPMAPPPAQTASRDWPYSQVAMLREGDWEAFFLYGQRSASHAQGDALAYELRYRGVPVTSDQGSAAYGSTLFLDYLRRSVAHDAPIVDGHGQATFKPGQLISFADGRIAARHDGYPGASVTRSLSVGDKGAADTTTITATGGAARRLGVVFNADCPVTPAGTLTPGPAPAGDGFGWWRQTQVSGATTRWSATLACAGGASFTLALDADRPGRVFVSQAPDRAGRYGQRTAIYFEAGSTPALTLRTTITPR